MINFLKKVRGVFYLISIFLFSCALMDFFGARDFLVIIRLKNFGEKMNKYHLIVCLTLCVNMNAFAYTGGEAVSFENISSQLDFDRNSYDRASGLGGLAWFDYDNDGDADLYISNGPGKSNALYRNDNNGQFIDVSKTSGVASDKGTSGVLAGDINNDGHIDLFLIGAGGDFTPTNTSSPTIFKNNGDGTFTDVTDDSGIYPVDNNGLPLTETSAWSGAMADIDKDGDLDLYIVAPGNLLTGKQVNGKFFLNDGNFKFSDITEKVGLGGAERGTCAAGFSDYDNDNDVDLFIAPCQKFIYDPYPIPVALEATPIELYRNDGGLKFTEVTVESKLNSYPGFWMALSFSDVNHDGHMDFFSTNAGFANLNEYENGVAESPHGLFINNGDGTFIDIGVESGLGHYEIGWGAAFTDFDNDGFSDIFFTGSLPIPPALLVGTGLGNPGRLFINDNTWFSKSNTFTEDKNLGLNLENEFTSGVAHADFDNNGFSDIAVVREKWSPNSGTGLPLLLKNNGNENNWVGIQLEGRESNRFGVGAKVMVNTWGMCQFQEVAVGSSFASTDYQRLNFGLNKSQGIKKIMVVWPSGRIELFNKWKYLRVNEIHHLVEGEGYEISKRKYKRIMNYCQWLADY